jgi:hypothetical protein
MVPVSRLVQLAVLRWLGLIRPLLLRSVLVFTGWNFGTIRWLLFAMHKPEEVRESRVGSICTPARRGSEGIPSARACREP